MNDKDRVELVENVEYLYNWWLSEKIGIWAFVRKYRKEINQYALKIKSK